MRPAARAVGTAAAYAFVSYGVLLVAITHEFVRMFGMSLTTETPYVLRVDVAWYLLPCCSPGNCCCTLCLYYPLVSGAVSQGLHAHHVAALGWHGCMFTEGTSGGFAVRSYFVSHKNEQEHTKTLEFVKVQFLDLRKRVFTISTVEKFLSAAADGDRARINRNLKT